MITIGKSVSLVVLVFVVLAEFEVKTPGFAHLANSVASTKTLCLSELRFASL